MVVKAANVTVRVWSFGTLLLERYIYSPGSVEPIPKHAHADYQFALCVDQPGEYHYRGTWHQIPKDSLSIIHPGEIHAPSETTYLSAPANYWMMSAPETILQAVASEVTEGSTGIPFFAEPFISNQEIIRAYANLHCLIEQPATQLEQDSALLSLLTQLIMRHAQNQPAIAPVKSARPAVQRVEEFLRDHFAENVSLEQLTEIAQLTRFHLCRAFRHEIGLAPHTYQMQLRVDYAKRLLNQKQTISDVATMTGFYDQSHFGRHFKRITGVTPSRYLSQSNNILDRVQTANS